MDLLVFITHYTFVSFIVDIQTSSNHVKSVQDGRPTSLRSREPVLRWQHSERSRKWKIWRWGTDPTEFLGEPATKGWSMLILFLFFVVFFSPEILWMMFFTESKEFV